METISFGMTDGDAEAAVLSPITGYNVRLTFADGLTMDCELVNVDNTGIVVWPIDDETSQRVGDVTTKLEYRDFEDLHVF